MIEKTLMNYLVRLGKSWVDVRGAKREDGSLEWIDVRDGERGVARPGDYGDESCCQTCVSRPCPQGRESSYLNDEGLTPSARP